MNDRSRQKARAARMMTPRLSPFIPVIKSIKKILDQMFADLADSLQKVNDSDFMKSLLEAIKESDAQ